MVAHHPPAESSSYDRPEESIEILFDGTGRERRVIQE
jgi:hypothetical protein